MNLAPRKPMGLGAALRELLKDPKTAKDFADAGNAMAAGLRAADESRKQNMSHLETECYHGVQAALLNSECHPRAAVQKALKAVAEFAETEVGLPIAVGANTDVEARQREEFLRLAGEAWDARTRT